MPCLPGAETMSLLARRSQAASCLTVSFPVVPLTPIMRIMEVTLLSRKRRHGPCVRRSWLPTRTPASKMRTNVIRTTPAERPGRSVWPLRKEVLQLFAAGVIRWPDAPDPLDSRPVLSAANSNRKSSCWRSAGTCAFPYRTGMWRRCSKSAGFPWTTSPCGGGSNGTRPNWRSACTKGSRPPTTPGGWTKRTSG